jgi:hypothetical protein
MEAGSKRVSWKADKITSRGFYFLLVYSEDTHDHARHAS